MKSPQAFRSIGEVAQLIGVATHVLRYWETQFPALAPVRRPDGRRYYRPDDVQLAAGLCVVMREEGLTIRGARKMLARDRGEAFRARGSLRLGPAFALPDSPDDAAPATTPHTAPDPQQEAQDMPGNHSRHRRRRHVTGSTSLPLFPDLPISDGGDMVWLVRLMALSALLRHPPQPCPQRFRMAAIRLHDAIDALNTSLHTN